MRAELEKLIDLQKTDTEIRRLKKAIETADQRRAAIEQEFERHASSIREVQNRLQSARVDYDQLEKQIVIEKGALERSERNLKHAQNVKEYESAIREVDAIQKKISALETEILEKMSIIEETERILAERADEINQIETRLEAALSEFETSLAEDKAKLETAVARRRSVFDELPKNLTSVYERLAQRSRDGIAVAKVVGTSCSACFMSLRPQILLEVKRGQEIISCESCLRILYFEAEETPSEAAAK